MNPENIQLVLQKGNIRLFDEEIKNQLTNQDFSISQFSRIMLNGKVKYVYGDLVGFMTEILSYYPGADLPVSVCKN